ncbi:hypothetical protein AXF42_Ash018133 [Apostasia shenzhenica]|uniref:Uncharacterized protein n=1 Tax=Apostasia shenzhenica TaxID=1088818 RepID=A0A2I0AF19_9ASPA|nr:hypothetical protein AXF42_Ash018133 [Apostasia shenzhenica]
MKRERVEASLPPSRVSQSAAKPQKRPAKPKPAAAGEKLRKGAKRAMPAAPTLSPLSPPPPPISAATSASSPADLIQIPWDTAWELDGWCWAGVEEERLLGWFPFVDEDFRSFSCDYRGGTSGFFWEDYPDIWHLQHIHEIPSSANR